MYQRIGRYDQLEQLRDSTRDEHDWLDFKGNEKGEKWWDVAEDIAAFANTLGGVLLVGVNQDKVTRRIEINGLTQEEWAATKTHYENALKSKVSPQPMVLYADPIPIPGGDRVVLAVHVEPYIAGLVGAMYPHVDRAGNFKVSGAWQFPIRKGQHNVPLTPEQIPLYMPVQIRRMVVMLELVKEKKGFLVPWRRTPTDGSPVTTKPGVMKEICVDAAANVLRFNYHYDSTDTSGVEMAVPLDHIETVFENPRGQWNIGMVGTFKKPANNSPWVYQYFRG